MPSRLNSANSSSGVAGMGDFAPDSAVVAKS
jgi:hypothetical protein